MGKIGIIGAGQGGKNPDRAGEAAGLSDERLLSKDNPWLTLDNETKQMILSDPTQKENAYTHATILEISNALWHEFLTELKRLDPDFDMSQFEVGGFSLGQLFAKWVAGVFKSPEDFRTFYLARASALDTAAQKTPSTMRVLMNVTREELAAALAKDTPLAQLVFPAIYPEPSMTVVGLAVESTDEGIQRLSQVLNKRIKAVDAGTVMAFHTPLAEIAVDLFQNGIAKVRHNLVVPDEKSPSLWSNSTGETMVDPVKESVDHLTQPVEFHKIIEGMLNSGVVRFITKGLKGNDTITKKINAIANTLGKSVQVHFVATLEGAKQAAHQIAHSQPRPVAAE